MILSRFLKKIRNIWYYRMIWKGKENILIKSSRLSPWFLMLSNSHSCVFEWVARSAHCSLALSLSRSYLLSYPCVIQFGLRGMLPSESKLFNRKDAQFFRKVFDSLSDHPFSHLAHGRHGRAWLLDHEDIWFLSSSWKNTLFSSLRGF